MFVVLGFRGLPVELFLRGFRGVRGAAVSETAVLPEVFFQDFPETKSKRVARHLLRLFHLGITS